jgi:hypothetical protein
LVSPNFHRNFPIFQVSQKLGNPLSGLRSAQLNESFLFILNGSEIESDIAEAAALFPSVREHLSLMDRHESFP